MNECDFSLCETYDLDFPQHICDSSYGAHCGGGNGNSNSDSSGRGRGSGSGSGKETFSCPLEHPQVPFLKVVKSLCPKSHARTCAYARPRLHARKVTDRSRSGRFRSHSASPIPPSLLFSSPSAPLSPGLSLRGARSRLLYLYARACTRMG